MVTNRQARISLSAVFASSGVFMGTWAARIADVQTAFHLSNAELGLVLACTTIGSIAGSTAAGFFSGRIGSRRLLRFSAPLVALAYALMSLAPSVSLLVAAMIAMGVTNMLAQVSMNTQAIALEARYRRTIYTTMHGSFSIGMMAGAASAALAAHFGVSYQTGLLGTSMVLLAVAFTIGFFLIETDRAARAHHPRIRLTLPLAIILAVIFFELWCEGTSSSWASVYMHSSVGASSALAALTVSIYSLTMTAGRLAGDRLIVRLGVGTLVGTGASIAACGLALALIFHTMLATLIGFGLFGLGLSCQAPTLFRAAGQLPLPEGQGVAAALFAGFPAFLLVSPVIGGVAHLSSLRTALWITVSSAAVMVALSGTLGRLAPEPLAEGAGTESVVAAGEGEPA
jgi:MFS family permease